MFFREGGGGGGSGAGGSEMGHIDHCARKKPMKFKIWSLYKMQSDNAAL